MKTPAIANRVFGRTQKSKRFAQQSEAMQIESLESRRLLSVSAVSAIAAFLTPGATRMTKLTAQDGSAIDYTTRAIGPTTFNGHSVIEVDVTSPESIAANASLKSYFSTDPSGDSVTYGDVSSFPNAPSGAATSTTVYSPYRVGVPATASAGVAQTFTYSETQTLTNSTGTTSTTRNFTESITLQSETPTSITVPAGTFSAYQVVTVETETSASDNSTTAPVTTTDWDVIGIGTVKSVVTGVDTTNSTSELVSYTNVNTHLAFSATPIPSTAAGKPLPSLVLTVRDENNNLDTAATGSITLTLASASQTVVSTGTLGGTLTQLISNGSATFSDLTVSADGVYQLTATDTNDDIPASSATFNIGQGLLVKKGPVNTDAGAKITPPVVVWIVDDKGKRDTKATSAITVSLAASSAGTGTLTGTTTVNAVAGVATFKDLRINKPGKYALTFSDSGASTINSAFFQVTGNKLVFKGRISNGVEGSAIHPAIMVGLVDSKGRKVVDGSSVVTLAITKIGTGSSGTITGTTAQLVNGVAVFSNLKFSQPGTYTIVATDDQDASSPGVDISITGLHLAFKMQPAEVGVNSPLKYKVAVEDYRNRLVNTSSIGLGLGLNVVSDGVNAAVSPLADTVDFGLAVNSGANPSRINAVGTYTITFTVISQSVDAFDFTIDPVTSKAFKVVANHLAFVKQPIASVVNRPLAYTVQLEDYRNHLVTSSDNLNITLIPVKGGTGAALTASVDTFFGGKASNTGPVPIAITGVGSYMLSVTDVPANVGDPVPAAVTSKVFSIKAVASI